MGVGLVLFAQLALEMRDAPGAPLSFFTPSGLSGFNCG